MQNLPLTSKQKFSFGWPGQAKAGQKRTFCFEVNGRFCTSYSVTLYEYSVPGIRRKSSRVRKPFCCLSSEVNRDHRRSIWDDVTGKMRVNLTVLYFKIKKSSSIMSYILSPEISRQCRRESSSVRTSSFPSWIFLLLLRIFRSYLLKLNYFMALAL